MEAAFQISNVDQLTVSSWVEDISSLTVSTSTSDISKAVVSSLDAFNKARDGKHLGSRTENSEGGGGASRVKTVVGLLLASIAIAATVKAQGSPPESVPPIPGRYLDINFLADLLAATMALVAVATWLLRKVGRIPPQPIDSENRFFTFGCLGCILGLIIPVVVLLLLSAAVALFGLKLGFLGT